MFLKNIKEHKKCFINILIKYEKGFVKIIIKSVVIKIIYINVILHLCNICWKKSIYEI